MIPKFMDDAHMRSPRFKALLRCFDRHGWPIAGKDVERYTKGQVTSHYVTKCAATHGRGKVRSIGAGLFVPAAMAEEYGLPMSIDVARRILAIEPGQIIDDIDDMLLFKIALILGRRGFAEIQKSRTTRKGIRRQTIKLALTEEGRALLVARTRLATDEF